MPKGRKRFHKPKRHTVRQAFAWGMRNEEEFLTRAERTFFAETIKHMRYHRRRFTVGTARAFFGDHFFAGCYVGAEND
jgi:hypothetical protein